MRGGTQVPVRPNPEKSLEELTHQDIMQLTREDCRRYLKEKGMRRPSWNKSQAIQQVLSLKNLFHSTPDDDIKSAKENAEEPAPAPVPVPVPAPAPAPAPPLQTQTFPLLQAAFNSEVSKLDWLADAELPVLASQPPSISGQNVFFNKQSGAQLTIFYSGNVNVYNDVPAEKAQAIMLLAGAGNHLPCSRMDTPYPSRSCVPATLGIPFVTTTQIHKETPVTRKASLQRFLEKKKDRSRCKTSASASKKPPMLMGMFMHPSYWSEAGKKKATKSNGGASPTRPPQTPSSDEQALISCRRKSMIEDGLDEAL